MHELFLSETSVALSQRMFLPLWGTTDLPLHILPTVILHYVVILMYCRGSFIQNSSSSLTNISKIILVDIICQCV
jgi:hypothetical protein